MMMLRKVRRNSPCSQAQRLWAQKIWSRPQMKKFRYLSILIPLMGAAAALHADSDQSALVVTASNAAQNQLIVYNSGGQLIQTIPTQGQGGVGGNSGGIEAKGNVVAVVNFGSQSVSIFKRGQ